MRELDRLDKLLKRPWVIRSVVILAVFLSLLPWGPGWSVLYWFGMMGMGERPLQEGMVVILAFVFLLVMIFVHPTGGRGPEE